MVEIGTSVSLSQTSNTALIWVYGTILTMDTPITWEETSACLVAWDRSQPQGGIPEEGTLGVDAPAETLVTPLGYVPEHVVAAAGAEPEVHPAFELL